MKQILSKTKVMVAMSGGVDSSVAAALLVRAGYDVTGAYMLNYVPNQPGGDSCWLPDYRDAIRVAAHLGIPLIKLGFTKEYSQFVLDYMFKEYEAGRTPNPDVLCNRSIKFGVWLNKAREMGFDFLATGHYARVRRVNSKQKIVNRKFESRSSLFTDYYSLFTSQDENKDQTYFLHQLVQAQLQHVMFPIGEYTKPEVRVLARKFGLPTAEKEESMGICFVGEVPMHEFLMQRIKLKPGNIVLSDETILGQHDGLPFYTIGQRHIGINAKFQMSNVKSESRPLYVVAKRFDTNELVVGYEDDPLLYKSEIKVENVNWIVPPSPRLRRDKGGQAPKFPLQCEVRLRHRQPLQKCVVNCHSERSVAKSRNLVTVQFATPQRAVTPGQFAVFYKKGECLGGGVIA